MFHVNKANIITGFWKALVADVVGCLLVISLASIKVDFYICVVAYNGQWFNIALP